MLAAIGKYFGVPWFPPAAFVAAGEMLAALWLVGRDAAKSVLLCGSAALLTLMAADLVLRFQERTIGAKKIFSRAQNGSFSVRSLRADNGATIYDVAYTLDRNGFRWTKGGGAEADTFTFLGCSLTFGEGLADEQTMPSQFSADLAGAFTVINASFPVTAQPTHWTSSNAGSSTRLDAQCGPLIRSLFAGPFRA